MAGPDPNVPRNGAATTPGASPAPAHSQAAAAGAAVGSAVSSAVDKAGDVLEGRWKLLGGNERIVVVGALAYLVSLVLGLLLAKWSVGPTQIIQIVAILLVFVPIVLTMKSLLGVPRAAVARLCGGILAAYELIAVGYLISGISGLAVIDIVLTVVSIAGAFLFAFGAWRLTGGNILKDILGLAKVGGRSVGQLLVSLGAAAVIVAWLLLGIAKVDFTTIASLAILAAVVDLTVLWLAGPGSGTLHLPVPENIILVIVGVVAAALALVWLGGVTGNLKDVPVIGIAGLVLFVAGAVATAAGGIRALMPAPAGARTTA